MLDKLINFTCRDESQLRFLLGQTITADSRIRSQDARYVYRAIGATAIGRFVQFDWLDINYDAILAFYGQAGFPGRVVDLLGGFMTDAKSISEVSRLQSFLDQHRNVTSSFQVTFALLSLIAIQGGSGLGDSVH